MTTASIFKQSILKEFPYSPTTGQEELIERLSRFIIEDKGQFPLFLLEGYAGTGKTTVIAALVNALPTAGYACILLAPTGRAAKILAQYSGQPAYTIHKRLYRAAMDADGLVRFQVSTNTATRTLFIVDEASMIPDGNQFSESGTFQQRNLLEDLIGHVYSGQACKLLFLGDPCQLPPVGSSISPALDKDLLKESYFLDVDHFELEDVVRQSLDSGILNEATRIRYKTLQYTGLATTPIFGHKNAKPDVISISGMDLAENLNDSYAKFGRENTVVITRSNKRANQFNQAIRQRILFQENELAAGDQLMVVRNNYFWLPEQSKAGFIANGDTIEVQSLRNFEEIYDFHFAEATIRLTDYPDENTLDVKLLLDTLQSESPSLPYPEYQKLFASVMEDYMHEPNRRKRLAEVRNNPYFNALQIKHSNALTCHKTQGGQWSVVYIDKGFLQDDSIDHEYLRWLYTAVTRATERLYLVNFEDSFFEG